MTTAKPHMVVITHLRVMEKEEPVYEPRRSDIWVMLGLFGIATLFSSLVVLGIWKAVEGGAGGMSDFILEPLDDDEDFDGCEHGVGFDCECAGCENDPIGCLFPGKCCMPGMHLESECHTAEMMEQLIEDGQA